MFKNYFKTAWKSLWNNKGTSIINISGLSIGMTAAILIMIWVENELTFDNYKGNETIFRLTTKLQSNGWVWETTPLLLADAIGREIPEIEKTTRLNSGKLPVFNIKGQMFYERNCAYVDKEWFNLFQYNFKAGSAESFNRNPFSIILSATEAKKYFGTTDPVGQTIHIDSIDYQVSAVVNDAPANSSFRFKAYIPLAALLSDPKIRENDEQWGNDNYVTFVKAAPGISPDNIAKKITEVLKKKSGDPDAPVITMTSLTDMHFETEIQNSAFVHGSRNTVYIFSFLGFLLLLIACINYVNLTTARSSIRAKEVSIRKINGASRANLFIQFIIESLLISMVSLLVTLALVQLCLPALNQLTKENFSLPLTSGILWQVLLITLFSSIVLNSIYPALVLSSFKPLNVFRGITVLRAKNSFFRKGLVILQFTVSVVLITGTLIIYSQMKYIQDRDPGYNRSQAIYFTLPSSMDFSKRVATVRVIKEELLSQRGIEGVTTSNQPIVDMESYCSGCADWKGRDTTYNPKIAQLSADADFLRVLHLQMKQGRWFTPGSVADKHSFILNETALKELSLQEPVIGQTFIFKGDTGRIIGVVKDFMYKSMHEKSGALVVFDNENWRSQFTVRAAPNSVPVALANIQKVWKQLVPEGPLEYTFLDDTFNNLYREDHQSSVLIFIFAGIAIFISALGLFSLAAFEAEQRIKEIGIRKVLGATVVGIASLLSKDFVKLVCIAIGVALPVAWWAMNKWLENFAYRISVNWWIFVLASLIAIILAVITISFQAIKAAIADPVKSLRAQ